jgi:hypothetical protein
MRTTTHISFEELADNLAHILNTVRDEHTTIVVEYASGEKLVIQPLPPTKKNTRRSRKKTKAEQGAVRAAAGSGQREEAGKVRPPMPFDHIGAREDQIDHTEQHSPNRVLDEGEVGATGTVYELDEHSLTAG